MANVAEVKTPPLAVDTIFTDVKGVKSWRRLAKSLIHAYYQDDSQHSRARYIPGATDLDAFQCQLGSDEECLKTVVEKFLQSWRKQSPPWRAVIWSLCKANEIQTSSSIKSYAEPLQGTSLTADNVTKVMEIALADGITNVWEIGMKVVPLVEAISGNLSTAKEKTQACVELYLSPSWRDITSTQYDFGELDAAGKAKSF